MSALKVIDAEIRRHSGGELALEEAPHVVDESEADKGAAGLVAALHERDAGEEGTDIRSSD